MPSTPSPVYRRALLALIALQCLLILAFVLRGLAAPGPFGPRLPAVQGDTLWLESHGALHQFNSDGKRLRRIDLTALGLTSPTSLQFTGEDNVVWTHDESRVHRCDLLRHTCIPIDLPDLSDRRDYRWVRVSDDASEIVVSDASRHRVLIYRRDAATGRYALAQTHADDLRFPNQTLQVGPAMWIADTNHHRIAQIPDAPQSGQASASRTNFPIAHAALRPGRKFPFAMALDPQMRLWVLVAGPGMGKADLLLMDRHLRPERVVAISPDQNPNAIALFQQHLLLTDMTGFTVHRLDLNGRALAPFGDEAFRSELVAAQSKARWTDRLPSLLLGSICMLLLPGLWLAWKAGELRQLQGTAWRARTRAPAGSGSNAAPAAAPAADAPPRSSRAEPPAPSTPCAPPARGPVTVVKALAGSTRARRRALLGTQLVMALVLLALAYWFWPMLYGSDCAPGKACPTWLRWLLLAFPLFPLFLSAGVWRRLKALESVRIGTDGIQVQVRMGERRYKAPAHHVTLTRQQLLIGRHMVPLRINGTPLFDEEALRRDIIDRLPQLNVHDGVWSHGGLVHYWRFAGWQGRAVLLLGAASVLFMVWANLQ